MSEPPKAEPVGEANASVGEANASVGEANAAVGEANAAVGEANAAVGEANAAVGSTPPSSGIGIDEPVPKLPRGRGMKFSGPEIFRILLLVVTLVGVVVLTKPCANAVSGFVTSFDGSGSSKARTMPKPGNVDMPRDDQYEQLKPGMTPEEIKAAMERSRARNAAANAAARGSATGSAATGSAATGSAATGSAATGSAATD